MNKTTLMLALFAIILLCSFKKHEDSYNAKDLKMEVKVTGWEKDHRYGELLAVTACLINESQDTICFSDMLCHYQEVFKCYGSGMSFFFEGCDKEFPKTYDIPPGCTCSYDLLIWYKNDHVDLPVFKIGFIWIPGKNCSDLFINRQAREKNLERYKTIWAPTVLVIPYGQFRDLKALLFHRQEIDWEQYQMWNQPRFKRWSDGFCWYGQRA